MDLLDRMNGAMDYIEENITEAIDFEKVARIACCSANHFQRMFSFITGFSLSEYIRRRKLTIAAFELQNSNLKIIDLALKYGYDSPDSFTRAFQKLHGVTPTSARETGVILKSYPKMTFYIKLKGDSAMDYRIVEKEAFELIGKGIMVNMENGGQKAGTFWQQSESDGTCKKMKNMSQSELSYGVTCYWHDSKNDTWSYHIAYENKAGLKDINEEFEILKIPALTWVVFESSAPLSQAIKELWGKAYSEWFPTSGYTDLGGPEMEVYHSGKLELWISIKKQ